MKIIKKLKQNLFFICFMLVIASMFIATFCYKFINSNANEIPVARHGGGYKYVTISEYSIPTVVTEVNHKDNTVTCVDNNGNLWSFYGAKDWFINDIAKLTMSDNGTKNIYDDVILSVKYDGYIREKY